MQAHSPLVAHNDGKNNYNNSSLSIHASDTVVSALHTWISNKGVSPCFCNTVLNAC